MPARRRGWIDEIGSGRAEQIERTLRQATCMAAEPADGLTVVPSDGRRPQELAGTIFHLAGWLPPQDAERSGASG